LQTTSIYVTHDQAEAMTLGDRVCVMYNGEIQQVAAPMEVYDKPVNRFVAGFLGTPPMNFFDGKIELQNGTAAFVMKGGSAIQLGSMNHRLSAYAGKAMVAGIRPEHLRVQPLSGQNGNAIVAQVGLVEPLGDHKEVYLTSVSGCKFIANLNPRVDITVDQQISIYVDTDKVHIFELGEVGRNIGI